MKVLFECNLLAIFGTCFVTVIRIVEMLQNRLTFVSGLSAYIGRVVRCNVFDL